MATIKITIQNKDRLISALKQFPAKSVPELRKATSAAAFLIEGESKMRSPVDTGRLRSSIATSLGVGNLGIGAIVQTNVFYAVYVHEGTRKMSGRPFMKQAVDTLEGRIAGIYTDAIERIVSTI